MDIYSLSRSFWDFSFENPEKMKPIHSSIFFFAIEHCNRLWWKDKFWFPTTMVMDAIWISNYSSYKKWLEELVEWGFIKMIQVSKNQYSANVISLIQFVWSTDKALDKALIKHGTKQHTKQVESIASIDIQVYNSTNVPITNIQDISKDIWVQALVISDNEKRIDNRNSGTQRIIDMVKNQVEEEWYLYDNNKEERNRATIISKRQSDWWLFIKETPEEREEEIIRSIISFSNQNEYSAKIRSVRDFHEKWKKVANSMKQENKKEQEIYSIPTY